MKQNNKNKIIAITVVTIIVIITSVIIIIVNNLIAIILLSCLAIYICGSILDDTFNDKKDEKD